MKEKPTIKIVATHVKPCKYGKLTAECDGDDFLQVAHKAYNLLFEDTFPEGFLIESCKAVVDDILAFADNDVCEVDESCVRTVKAAIQTIEYLGAADWPAYRSLIQMANAWLEETVE